MSQIRYNLHAVTGTLTGLAPGSQANGTALFIGQSERRVDDLSAHLTVLAETNTLTITAKWQGSNDRSTWIDLANGSQNASGVALATGTAGADASVTRSFGAPNAAYAHQFVRCSLVVGVVTGTDNDTYSVGYSYRQLDPGERGG